MGTNWVDDILFQGGEGGPGSPLPLQASITQLRAITAAERLTFKTLTTLGDHMTWVFDAADSSEDDGIAVIKPNDVPFDGSGRWIRATDSLTVQTIAQLQTLKSGKHSRCHVLGYNAAHDGGGGAILWNATDTRAHDGVILFRPIGLTVGNWERTTQEINSDRAGMKGDLKVFGSGNATASSVTFTDTSANPFRPEDVGKAFTAHVGSNPGFGTFQATAGSTLLVGTGTDTEDYQVDQIILLGGINLRICSIPNGTNLIVSESITNPPESPNPVTFTFSGPAYRRARHYTTIASYIDASTITLTDACPTSNSPCHYSYGTDNKAGLDRMVAACYARGQKVAHISPRSFLFRTAPAALTASISLLGEGAPSGGTQEKANGYATFVKQFDGDLLVFTAGAGAATASGGGVENLRLVQDYCPPDTHCVSGVAVKFLASDASHFPSHIRVFRNICEESLGGSWKAFLHIDGRLQPDSGILNAKIGENSTHCSSRHRVDVETALAANEGGSIILESAGGFMAESHWTSENGDWIIDGTLANPSGQHTITGCNAGDIQLGYVTDWDWNGGVVGSLSPDHTKMTGNRTRFAPGSFVSKVIGGTGAFRGGVSFFDGTPNGFAAFGGFRFSQPILADNLTYPLAWKTSGGTALRSLTSDDGHLRLDPLATHAVAIGAVATYGSASGGDLILSKTSKLLWVNEAGSAVISGLEKTSANELTVGSGFTRTLMPTLTKWANSTYIRWDLAGADKFGFGLDSTGLWRFAPIDGAFAVGAIEDYAGAADGEQILPNNKWLRGCRQGSANGTRGMIRLNTTNQLEVGASDVAALKFPNVDTGHYGHAGGPQPTDIVSITDNVLGSISRTIASIPDPTDSPVSADALRDDLVTNVIPAIRDAISSLIDWANDMRDKERSNGRMA